ncbi:putative BolA protein [Helianthus annuus]|nr:putative BolA protein [Helianthus annuus]
MVYGLSHNLGLWCGASFKVEIVSEQFEGKRLLDRHRMVNGALAEEMKDIHALSITKALTPDQWNKQQQSQTSQPVA